MKSIIRLFTAALITVVLFQSCQEAKSQDPPPEPKQTITNGELSIPVYDESALDYYLNIEDDNVHVVNFWATWCAPCIKELPYFERIHEEFDDDGVDVTLVSLDFEGQLESKLLPYVEENLKSDVIAIVPTDEQAMIQKVSKNWQTGAIPVTLIYNKNKSYFIEGETTYDELVEQIKQFKL